MKGGKRAKAGRKAVNIDLEQVEKLAAIQCTEAEIASVFGVSVRTIERRKQQPAFAEAMARGKATRTSVTAPQPMGAWRRRESRPRTFSWPRISWATRITSANELSGPDGGADRHRSRAGTRRLTDEELKQLAILVGKTERPRKG